MNMCQLGVNYDINFPYAHIVGNFLHNMTSFKSINIFLRLASTTAVLIPYNFRTGIKEQIPDLLGPLQVPVQSLSASGSVIVPIFQLIVCNFPCHITNPFSTMHLGISMC